ncbi:MAG: hypothetical protein KIT11_08395 [Fimbriimonadaceae bacterium]|nr:hypothetical protein [Fimbriimonadaceae bacterium]QYK56372.1 MAG: hypothetical protein KF733_02590 [Fimbriimonadaceae bacterium]
MRDLRRLRDRVRTCTNTLTGLCFAAGQVGDTHRARLFAGAASRALLLLDEVESIKLEIEANPSRDDRFQLDLAEMKQGADKQQWQ